MLLKADANGPAWTDARIADAFDCHVRTVREATPTFRGGWLFSGSGWQKAVSPTRCRALDGEQEAKVIAVRMGARQKGYAHWTLRLLARKRIALEVVETIGHETVRQTLKKTG